MEQNGNVQNGNVQTGSVQTAVANLARRAGVHHTVSVYSIANAIP